MFQTEDKRKCVFCGEVGDQSPQDAGRLLYFNIDEWAHANCVLWSAEVYEDDEGRLQNAHIAITRGRQLVSDITTSYAFQRYFLFWTYFSYCN